MTDSGTSPGADSARDDPSRKWWFFSISIVAVLGLSFLAVVASMVTITYYQMGALVRDFESQKALRISRFVARAAFVPLSLEDNPALERVVLLYSGDPDVASITVSDAQDQVLVSRRQQKAIEDKYRIDVVRPVYSPEESGAAQSGAPLGAVKVSISLHRAYWILNKSILWIMSMAAAMLLLALFVNLALILWMTRRLRDLVGEARMAEELRRSNKDLEQFAFVASHDLQEPLRKVISYCQLLQRRYGGKLDAQADQFIEIIVKGGTRMSDLIRDLLAYARVGTQTAPAQAVDCAAIFRETAALLQETIRASGAKVTAERLPVVKADPTQVGQLFQNLVGNAVKFRGDKPPEVRVKARRQGSFWRISVQDNGIGIDPRFQDRIFDMFQRLHGKEKYPGTGIGLAICKRIVERHGGRIWVDSVPGQGTTFNFTLPEGGKS